MLCAFCVLIIHSTPAFCTGTGTMPPRPFHHKRLQLPRSLRERRSPGLKHHERRLPGRGRQEGMQQNWADCRMGQSGPRCHIRVEMSQEAVQTLTQNSYCDRKVSQSAKSEYRHTFFRLLKVQNCALIFDCHLKTGLQTYAPRSPNELKRLPGLKPTGCTRSPEVRAHVLHPRS